MAHDIWTLDKDYADGETLDEADLDAAFDSGTNWSSDVKDNFTQILLDAFPSGYELDNDGAANLTNSLYNKQSASVYYEDNVINLAKVVASATKMTASLDMTLTPEATGKYFISYEFCLELYTRSNGDIDSYFTIVDETNAATLAGRRCGILGNFTGGAGGVGDSRENFTPVSISRIINITDTSAATYTLYHEVINSTATIEGYRIVCGADGRQDGVYGQIHKI